MDYLVQRYLPGTANEAHRNSGSWEDVDVIRDLAADEYEKAMQLALTGVAPLPGPSPDRVRAFKYEHMEEMDATLGGFDLAPAEKGPRGKGK